MTNTSFMNSPLYSSIFSTIQDLVIVLGSSIAAIVSPKRSKKTILLFTLLILCGTKPPRKYGPNKLGKEIEQKTTSKQSRATRIF